MSFGVNRVKDATLERLERLLSSRVGKRVGDPTLRPSAVLLLLYPKDGSYCILFNKRTDSVEFNKGDICFPGGARDPQDEDLKETALREAYEEMGIHPEDVAILGELDEDFTRAGFAIHPFVGTIAYPYSFTVSSAEVAEVLEVPLSLLYDGESVREEARAEPDGRLVRTYVYPFHHHLIYGATARILTQLLDLIRGEEGLKEELVA